MKSVLMNPARAGRWSLLKAALATSLLLLLALTACTDKTPPPLEGPDRHALGAPDAPVLLVAFDDYQ
jgi:hypothetical protein